MSKGFTLIEMLVVVGIVAIVVAISIPLYAKYTTRAFKGTIISDVRNTVNAIEAFVGDFKTLPNSVTCPNSGFGPAKCNLTDGTNTTNEAVVVSKGVRISYIKVTGGCSGANTYKIHGVHNNFPNWGFCFDACLGEYFETDGSGCP